MTDIAPSIIARHKRRKLFVRWIIWNGGYVMAGVVGLVGVFLLWRMG